MNFVDSLKSPATSNEPIVHQTGVAINYQQDTSTT